MKKIAALGLAAFCLIAVVQQEASAWTNSKFGIGLNWERQAGGNSAAWGLWRNGQPPGPDGFGGGMPFGAPRMAVPPQAYYPQAIPQQGFAPAPAPIQGAFQGTFVDPSFAGQMNYGNPYQFANYPRPVYYYYGSPFDGR